MDEADDRADRIGAPGFTGARFTRVDRTDATAWQRARADPAASLLCLAGLDPVVDGAALAITLLGDRTDTDLALLGVVEGRPLFISLSADAAGSPPLAVMAALVSLASGEAALYAAARSLVAWHMAHPRCARCGDVTSVDQAGWARRCGACGRVDFPRTDPVAIMLAEHDGRVLVGRHRSVPGGFYSALAGFIEVGESIEEAVARELREEAGVEVRSVRYVASQPWPFPSQLMIGCIAPVVSPALRLDESELDDAIWVDPDDIRAAIRQAPDARFRIPPPLTIAHTLLARWAAGAALTG